LTILNKAINSHNNAKIEVVKGNSLSRLSFKARWG
jgi:hypothetical protein